MFDLNRRQSLCEDKDRLIQALVLVPPDFSKVFEIACDISGVGIGGVFSQEGHQIAFSSEEVE